MDVLLRVVGGGVEMEWRLGWRGFGICGEEYWGVEMDTKPENLVAMLNAFEK